LPTAQVDDNITVTTSKGYYGFRVSSVRIDRKYERLAVCPDVMSISDVLTISSSYHCESGAGSGVCDRNFGGWSASDKTLFSSSTEFFHEIANDGGGRCAATWDVSHCAALTPNSNIKELTIVKLIEETCLIDISAENKVSLKQGEPLRFGSHGTISFKSNCATDSRPYAAVSDGLLFDDMLAKSQEYATLCPVYKNEQGDWKIRRSSVVIRRTGFDSWDSSVSWAGTAEGRNLTSTMTVTSDDKQVWKTTEKIPPSSLAYSVSVCGDERFREVYISSRSTKCDLVTFEFGGYGFSSTNGNPVTLMEVTCRLPDGFSACKASIYQNKVITPVHFNCPGYLEINVGASDRVYLRSKNALSAVIPTRDVEDAYGHDARFTTVDEHESIWNSIGSPFTSAMTTLKNMIPIFLTIGIIVVFPGFFSNNLGMILLVLVFLKFMPGADAVSVDDYSLGTDEEITAILCAIFSVYSTLLTPIALCVLGYMTKSRISPILHGFLMISSFSDDETAKTVVAFSWYLLIRFESVTDGIDAMIRETQERVSELFSPVYGDVYTVCLPRFFLKGLGYRNRSTTTSFNSIEVFLYQLSGTERCVTRLSLTGIKPGMVKKRLSTVGNNVKGMKHTLFYEEEYSKTIPQVGKDGNWVLRTVKDLLSTMDSTSIKNTWDLLPAITGRKPWDFSSFQDHPDIPIKLKEIIDFLVLDPG